MAPKIKFIEGEKVLCFHGPLIYAAKCLKVSTAKEKQTKYLIHYAGWNKNWDEWVSENCVLKYNEANCQKQKEVLKAHNLSVKTKKGSLKKKVDAEDIASLSKLIDQTSTSKEKEKEKEVKEIEVKQATIDPDEPMPSTSSSQSSQESSSDSQSSKSSDGSRRKSSRKETPVDPVMEVPLRVEVTIIIPDGLKVCLVTDWFAINKEKRLAVLPAKDTALQVLQNYVEYETSKGLSLQKESLLTDFIEGIKQYFNSTLSIRLLYETEKSQYKEICQQNPNTTVLELYGVIHLVRLFVKIGWMLSYSSIQGENLDNILGRIHRLLDYINSNISRYFRPDDYYQNPNA